MDIKSPPSSELEPMTNVDTMPTMTSTTPVVDPAYQEQLEASEAKKSNKYQIPLIVIGLVILALGLFWLLGQPANPVATTNNSTTNSSNQVAIASPSASPASTIAPTPTPASSTTSQTPGVLSLGSAGGSGSNSGGGSSTSSTSLTTDNKYNYYQTLANGQLVAVDTPTPTPTPTSNPTPTVIPTPAPSGPTPTPTVLGTSTTSGNFLPKTDIAAPGIGPLFVTTADLNVDGKQDMIVANNTAGTISVYLGNGNGTFATKVDYTAGSNPQSITVADLNGDGKLDLAVGNYAGNSISVFLGNGDGTVAAKVDYTTGSGPQSVIAVDLNGDSRPDLAVVNSGTTGAAGLSVFINSSSTPGTFPTKTDYTTGNAPNSVYAGDFDGDNRPDLAVVNYSSAVSAGLMVYINSHTTPGTFPTTVNYTTGSTPTGVTGADFNGDGKIDLTVSNYSSSTVSVFMNNGTGTFAAKVDYSTPASGPTLYIIAKDFNGDGKPDIAIDNRLATGGVAGMSVYTNSGVGTFPTRSDYNTGVQPCSLASADFNTDSKPDIAVVNWVSNTISIFLNTADYAVSPASTSLSNGANNIYSVATGDFNGDGKMDAAAANGNINTVSVYINTGTGLPSSPTLNLSTGYAASLAAGDFNGDGKTDLAVGGASLTIFLNSGTGNGLSTGFTRGVGSFSRDLAVGDFNGDGKLDIATTDPSSTGANGAWIFINDGSAQPIPAVSYKLTTGSGPYSVAAADYNGDGKTDLAVANQTSGGVGIYIATGTAPSATLPTTSTYNLTAGTTPTSVVAADFNGDGKVDVGVANSGSTSIFVYTATGAAPSITIPTSVSTTLTTSSGPNRITARDVNGDGRPDLIAANGVLSVFLTTNTGLPTSASYTLGSGTSFFASAVGDFNADGAMDIVAANNLGANSTVLVFLGQAMTRYFADGVIGQTDFTSSSTGTSSTKFNNPSRMALDTVNHRLFTVDYINSRVLVFNLDSNNNLIDKTADYVLGQNGLNTGASCSTISATCMTSPHGLAYDSVNNRLFVSDYGNNRVLVFNAGALNLPGTNNTATAVMGQPGFTTNTNNQTQAGLYSPYALAYDSARHYLYIAEYNGHRVTVQNVGTAANLSDGVSGSGSGCPAAGNGQCASYVIGQTSFTGVVTGTTSQRFNYGPNDLAYDAANARLFVSDPAACRVLVFNLSSMPTVGTLATASYVLGQTSFTDSTCSTTTQSTFYGNYGALAYDPATNILYVGDYSGNRVMLFDVTSATMTNGKNAKAVIGQSSYATRSSGTSNTAINGPLGLVVDSGNNRLYLSEQDNNRILIFNSAAPTNPPTSFVFAGSSSQTAGVYAAITATLHDVGGNVINATADTAIALTNNISNGLFYPTSSGGSPITSITITTGNSSATFWFRATQTGSGNITGNSSGFSTVNFADTVTADTASVAVLTPSTQTITAGAASSMVTLTTKDSFGNAGNVGSNTSFTLSSTLTGGQFSVLASPFTPITTVTVSSGTSSTTFFYRNNTAGSYTITAHAASGFSDGTASITVNPAAIASFYYATAPASGAAGAASTVFTVGAHDAFGNVVTVGSNTNVYLYSSAPAGTFSTTFGGTYTSALTVVITSGGTTTDFYYKNNSTSGSPYTLTASDNSSAPDGATGIVDATTSYAVNAGTAVNAVLTPATQTVTAGVVSSVVTLTTQDSLGNPSNVASNTSFALSSTGTGGQFSVLSSPFTPVSSVTVNSGTSSTTFYYRNNTAGNYTITAHAASGFTDGTAGIAVNPAAIASYYYATAPATGAAGVSSTVFTVGAHDAFGNVVTVGSNVTVYLYSSAPAGTFSNTTNAGPFTATSTTITTGNTTGSFYYKNNSTSGSPYTLTASDNSSAPDGATGIVDATTSYSVTAGTATVAVLSPSTQSVTAGVATSVINLTTKDSLGNTVAVASNTTFTLSDGGNGGVFSTSGSGGPYTATNVVVTSGSSTATFYYKNNTTGSYTLTAHNAGFTDGTTSVLVSSAAIASYYFSTTSSSTNINVASGVFTVGAHDVFGNVVTVASNTTVYLYSTSGTGTFSNSGSGGPFTATTVTILAGNTTATFYYKDATAGAYTLTASEQTPTPTPDTGATNATTAFTVFNPDVLVGPNMPLPVRSATVSDSRPGDPNVHFSWNSSTASLIKGIRIQVCTDGLANTACTTPTGSDLTPATLTSTGGQLGASGWAITTVVSAHEILITNATGAATTIGGTSTLDLGNFVNPTSIGTFFFRISTYTTTAALPGDSVSYGAIGTSTNRSITVTGDVAESLVFRVANSVASDCSSQTDIADPNDAASDLVTLSPNPMTMTTTSIGTAQMCATSNAEHGYTITYFDAALGGATKGFYNGAHEFAVSNQFTSTQGTEQFGFNLRANTTPAVGFDPDGNGLVADLTNADYSTVDRFSYNDTGSNTILAQKSAPNAATARYTLSYLANISSTTQGGTYKAHQVFVITATF